jgi:hypothetical protein
MSWLHATRPHSGLVDAYTLHAGRDCAENLERETCWLYLPRTKRELADGRVLDGTTVLLQVSQTGWVLACTMRTFLSTFSCARDGVGEGVSPRWS